MIQNSFCDKPKSILYQNEAKNITLIDVPQSIVDAQGGSSRIQSRLIQSCDPPTKPYASCEPKTEKGKQRVADEGKDAEYHNHFVEAAAGPLKELKEAYSGEWNLPRNVERREERDLYSKDDTSSLYGKIIRNDSDGPFRIQVLGSEQYITMPPHSGFVLGDILEICQFNLHLAPGSLRQPSYSFILMDPPWPNASAKRRSAYKRSASLKDVKNMLLDIPVPEMLAKDGLVGVWITNRSSFHDLVLEKDGLFEQWGVELLEEWIWVKTTTEGEPVVALDSTWRKPYEIILLGKRAQSPKLEPATRVIVGVPDVHSRKPCLKNLIEPLINGSKNCKVLEIFARYLVERWDSWGDEVFKFNREDYWSISNSKEAMEYQKDSTEKDGPDLKRRRINNKQG